MSKKYLINISVLVTLFEYDERFATFGTDFVFYDYRNPLAVPRDRNTYYDLVIADPPFLSEECLTKTCVTIKFLAKDKIVLCTGKTLKKFRCYISQNNFAGSTMSDLAKRLLNVEQVKKFYPKHKNNLANEFFCYSNYNVDCLL